MKFVRALPWILATAALGALAGGIAARMLAQKPIPLQSGTWLPQPRPLAAFELTDADGRPFGNAGLEGHASLLFLGYSYCPDVCPATLALVHEALSSHPLPDLRFFFITVDPARDTPAVLKQYLAGFGSDFTGLSSERGPPAALLRSLAAAAPERERSPDGGYRLAHSATLYLLNARGELVAVFSPPLSAQGLSADLRSLARAAVL